MFTQGRRFVPFTFVSAFPGRVRLRLDRRYARNGSLHACSERLAGLPGVRKVETVADAASVIVRYDSAVRDLDEIVPEIETTVATVLHVPAANFSPACNGASSHAA